MVTLEGAVLDVPSGLLHARGLMARAVGPLEELGEAVEEAGDFVYFTMDYVEGETLGERVRREGPLDVGEATRGSGAAQSSLPVRHKLDRGKRPEIW